MEFENDTETSEGILQLLNNSNEFVGTATASLAIGLIEWRSGHSHCHRNRR